VRDIGRATQSATWPNSLEAKRLFGMKFRRGPWPVLQA
jgi:hypothetical protein